jgi:hypothetical protein
MDLTLKKEVTKPAAKNFLQQQARFDAFIEHRPQCGRVCFGRLSAVFAEPERRRQAGCRPRLAGQLYGLDLGFFITRHVVESAGNPFAAKVLPMSPV